MRTHVIDADKLAQVEYKNVLAAHARPIGWKCLAMLVRPGGPLRYRLESNERGPQLYDDYREAVAAYNDVT